MHLSKSNIVFPGFLVLGLQELLDCLWYDVAELAGIGRDDRHHRIVHLHGCRTYPTPRGRLFRAG